MITNGDTTGVEESYRISPPRRGQSNPIMPGGVGSSLRPMIGCCHGFAMSTTVDEGSYWPLAQADDPSPAYTWHLPVSPWSDGSGDEEEQMLQPARLQKTQRQAGSGVDYEQTEQQHRRSSSRDGSVACAADKGGRACCNGAKRVRSLPPFALKPAALVSIHSATSASGKPSAGVPPSHSSSRGRCSASSPRALRAGDKQVTVRKAAFGKGASEHGVHAPDGGPVSVGRAASLPDGGARSDFPSAFGSNASHLSPTLNEPNRANPQENSGHQGTLTVPPPTPDSPKAGVPRSAFASALAERQKHRLSKPAGQGYQETCTNETVQQQPTDPEATSLTQRQQQQGAHAARQSSRRCQPTHLLSPALQLMRPPGVTIQRDALPVPRTASRSTCDEPGSLALQVPIARGPLHPSVYELPQQMNALSVNLPRHNAATTRATAPAIVHATAPSQQLQRPRSLYPTSSSNETHEPAQPSSHMSVGDSKSEGDADDQDAADVPITTARVEQDVQDMIMPSSGEQAEIEICEEVDELDSPRLVEPPWSAVADPERTGCSQRTPLPLVSLVSSSHTSASATSMDVIALGSCAGMGQGSASAEQVPQLPRPLVQSQQRLLRKTTTPMSTHVVSIGPAGFAMVSGSNGRSSPALSAEAHFPGASPEQNCGTDQRWPMPIQKQVDVRCFDAATDTNVGNGSSSSSTGGVDASPICQATSLDRCYVRALRPLVVREGALLSSDRLCELPAGTMLRQLEATNLVDGSRRARVEFSSAAAGVASIARLAALANVTIDDSKEGSEMWSGWVTSVLSDGTENLALGKTRFLAEETKLLYAQVAVAQEHMRKQQAEALQQEGAAGRPPDASAFGRSVMPVILPGASQRAMATASALVAHLPPADIGSSLMSDSVASHQAPGGLGMGLGSSTMRLFKSAAATHQLRRITNVQGRGGCSSPSLHRVSHAVPMAVGKALGQGAEASSEPNKEPSREEESRPPTQTAPWTISTTVKARETKDARPAGAAVGGNALRQASNARSSVSASPLIASSAALASNRHPQMRLLFDYAGRLQGVVTD